MKASAADEAPDWQAISHALSAVVDADQLDAEAIAYLENLSGSDQPWLLACSGGADSVWLSLWLHRFCSGRGQRLMLLHFDHGLRADSAADASFVARLAAGLDVAVRVGHWPLEQRDNAIAQFGLEAAARAARYGYFLQQAAEVGATVLLTGHHADDVVENCLLRIARGGAWQTLASPWPVRTFSDGLVRVRPLLTLNARQIRNDLLSVGALWCEDASNRSPAHLRNRLRGTVIPAIRSVYCEEQFHRGMLRIRKQLQELQQMVARQAADLLSTHGHAPVLAVEPLRSAPGPVAKEALRQWLLQQHNSHSTAEVLDAVIHAIHQGQRRACWNLAHSQRLELRDHQLHWVPGTPETKVPGTPAKGRIEVPVTSGFLLPGAVLMLPDGSRLGCEWVHIDRQVGSAAGGYQAWLRTVNTAVDCYLHPELGLPFRVRRWLPGDRWQPFGLAGRSRKLQDDFVNAKVPLNERRCIPVVTDASGTIVWVPGFPIAYGARLPNAQPLYALRLTYQAI